MQQATGAKESAVRERIYTPAFLLLFLSEFSVFAAFYVLLPIIPLYILNLGGTEVQIGLLLSVTGILGLFTAPLYGRAVDRWNRKRMLLLGLAVNALVAASFLLVRSVMGFLFPLLGRSVGSGASGTASRTLVFDIAPASRRGEAISTFMLSHNFAIAFGPAVGLFIMRGWGFQAPFLASAALCAVSFLLVTQVREPRREPRQAPAAPPVEGPRRDSWIVKEALLPSAVQLLLAMSYGSTIQFLAVVGEQRHIADYQVFFTVYAVVVIAIRLVTGRVSDRFGRAAVLLPALTAQTLALLLLSQADSLPVLAVSAVFFGMGWGAAYPALTALTADRVEPQRRGAAIGIFSAGMALGGSLGSASMGGIAQVSGFGGAFLFSGAAAFLGLVLCAAGLKRAGELTFRPAQAHRD